MGNEKENLEIKQSPKEVSEEDLKKVSGGINCGRSQALENDGRNKYPF